MVPRILIAEDDELQGAVLRASLVNRGYQADIVGNGLEAVRRLATGLYDVAVLDYHLPDVDGLAAARLLEEYLQTESHPGLIALTAAPVGLREKEAASGGTPFDAVIAKDQGMPALIAAIESSLDRVLARHALVASLATQAARKRRMRARFSALPFALIVGSFASAFAWEAASLHHMDAAAVAVQQASLLGVNATSLVDAVQDVEGSGLAYVATGAPAHRDAFMTDVARVDRMLVSQAPRSEDGAPGLAAQSTAGQVIQTRLGSLVNEVTARAPRAAKASVASFEAGREAIGQLRDWAVRVVSGSQHAASDGIEAAHRNARIVLLILVAGAVYASWSAYRVLRERRVAAPRALRLDIQRQKLFLG